jgi:diaminopimelate decarboxylase
MIGRPAVVAVRAGRARLILRRETVDDLLSLEVR